ncbi:MAG TPA: tetratricopeptide repeat protein, partial [Chitinophagales bacterium]|nr:tetratricopeptide repeat protein [Chitinophagales bacterium]
IGEPVPLLSLFLHLAIGLVAIYFMRRQPLVTYALAVYLISVATFSNYSVLIPGIVADRYLLLPSIGWSILLAFVLFAIWRVSAGTAERDFKTLPKGLKIASVAVLLLYSSITFARNFNWKDDLTLFRNDITYVKESAQANNLLGLHLMIHATQLPAGPEQKKLMQEALTHFKQTLVIAPGIFNTNFDVGRVYNLLEMPDSAVVYFDKAIAIDPSYYESHILAGQLKYRLGKPREAIPYYAYIIQNHPTEVRAYDFLSYVYFQLGEYQNSIAVNRQAVRYLPNSADPLINIGRVYESGYQNRDSAVYYYKMAYRINPLPELKKAVEMLGGKTDSK